MRCKALLIMLMLMIVIRGSQAETPLTDATSPLVLPRNTVNITIFNQDAYGSEKYQLAGYAGRTLETSGCFLFAYAHAQQYLTGQIRDDSLLLELLDVCMDPNGYYNHSRCDHPEKNQPAFIPFNRSQGSPLVNDALPEKNSSGLVTAKGLQEFFSRGQRVLCLHGSGHHVLAVEARQIGEQTYIHIIDSHWGSIQDHTGKPYFYLENGVMSPIAVHPDTYGFGADYWMLETDVANFFKSVFAWKLNPLYSFPL